MDEILACALPYPYIYKGEDKMNTHQKCTVRCRFFVITRQESSKKRSLHNVSEHFEMILNAVIAKKMHRTVCFLVAALTRTLRTATNFQTLFRWHAGKHFVHFF